MERFRDIVFSAAKTFDRIAQFAVILLAVIVVCNVIGRFFKFPILGSLEIIEMLLCILVSFSIAYCAVQKGHIAVTLVVNRLSQCTQVILGCITRIFSIALFMMIAVECGKWGTEAWRSHRVLSVVNVPIYPFIYIAGFGSFLLFLVVIVDLFDTLCKRGSK